MNVSMIGLGKLGLPVACAFASRGHTVYGYDTDQPKLQRYRDGDHWLYEPGLTPLLEEQLREGRLHLCDTVLEAVTSSELLFIAVPTPSLPDHSFDTSYVISAVSKVAKALKQAPHGYVTIALISTVLPQTCRQQVLPILERHLGPLDGEGGGTYGFAYNAQFIAMGTVVDDALNPEFVLIGEATSGAGDMLEQFYRKTLSGVSIGRGCPSVIRTTLENAELIKMTYNLMIGLKIVYGNTILELCDKIPDTDCDAVVGALSLATSRLISPAYLKGGLGDGGPCHPRDQRALSYLSKQLDLTANPFEFVSRARADQTAYVTSRILQLQREHALEIKLLGTTFKPGTTLTDDSPALLLLDQLKTRSLHPIVTWDPLRDPPEPFDTRPRLYVIGTAHPELRTYSFVPGSVIVDPWGLFTVPPEGCTLVAIGRNRQEV